MKKIFVVMMVATVALLAGCGNWQQSQAPYHAESKIVARQQDIYNKAEPIQVFNYSMERHLMIQLYQVRNTTVQTWSYVVSKYTNSIVFECPSIGYPIPAGMQLTNPDKTVEGHWQGEFTSIPQPEPNGLYSSPSTDGTYIMCTNPDGTITPVYSEPNVMAFAQRMKMDHGVLVPYSSTDVPTIKLNVHKMN